MTILLDTHVLLWALAEPSRLPPEARRRIEDPRQAVFVSAASVWEIAIKTALGKLRAPDDLEKAMTASRFAPLPITWPHAALCGRLPAHHRDPFDRMLVAQAKLEGLTLFTHDHALKSYGSFVQVI